VVSDPDPARRRALRRAARLLVIAGLLVCGAGVSVGAASSLQLQDPATGKSVDVGSGWKATHLVFFATWCPTCADEFQDLSDLDARWGEHGYRLIVVAVKARHSPERLARFVEDERPPGLLLFDHEGRAGTRWNAEHVPTHVVLDANGKEIARAGTVNEDIIEAITQLVAPSGRRGSRER
jgi:thiol-disulfide isomerase/thioredoxin